MFMMGDGSSTGMRFDFTSNHPIITLPNVGNFSATETASLDAWHYLVTVSNAGVQSMQMDGVQLTGFSGTHNMNYTSGFIGVGGYFSSGLNGYLAETAFYNSALGSTDISTLNTYARSRFGLA